MWMEWETRPMCIKVLGWAILWFTLYRSSFNLIKHKKPEYNCRMVTLLHAVVITISSCFTTFFNGTNPYSVLGLPNTHLQELIMSSSLGYFLYDFTWCLYHQTEDFVMLLHHVLSIAFLSVGLYLGVSGTELVATIFGTEITSIILNIRWFLKDHNLYESRSEITVDVLFVLMFIVVRMGVGGTLIYSVWLSDRSPLSIKIGGSAFYFTNILFFMQIVVFLRRKMKKWFGRTQNGKQANNGDRIKNGVSVNGRSTGNQKKIL